MPCTYDFVCNNNCLHNFFVVFQPGYWNLTDGVGCVPCICAGGSISNECDEVTGMCLCNEGVGEGDCSACLDGFFNFITSGCTGTPFCIIFM